MDNFIGELRVFSFNQVPQGWLQCAGQTLQINQYQALYALLGTQYGGNGTTNFMLPNLQGRAMLHFGYAQSGTTYQQGQLLGTENVALTQNTIPAHTHFCNVVNTTGTAVLSATNNSLAAIPSVAGIANENIQAFIPQGQAGTLVPLAPASVAITGGGAAHENRMPYLALQICIATTGLWPSRN